MNKLLCCALLAAAGIAGFRTPESCADAIRAWRDWTVPAVIPDADARALKEQGIAEIFQPGASLRPRRSVT